MEAAEAEAMDRLVPIYTSMPGFISYRYYTGEDGEEISIARFTDRGSMRAWVRQPDHVEVQKMAGDLYEDLWVQTAETIREARVVDGKVVDGVDLTDLLRRRPTRREPPYPPGAGRPTSRSPSRSPDEGAVAAGVPSNRGCSRDLRRRRHTRPALRP